MKVLVIPTVSSGNIPQLAVDLLLHSLPVNFTSRLDDQYLYPFAGPVDSVGGQPVKGITTAADVYENETVTLVQLRSPTLPGYRQKFVRQVLLPFIEQGKFDQVLVVTSSNSALQKTIPTTTESQIRLISSCVTEQLQGLSLESNKVTPLPEELPESGFALDILKEVPSSCGMALYAYEGDNFKDAEQLASHIQSILGLSISSWQRPTSWKGAYGKEIPLGVEEGLYS